MFPFHLFHFFVGDDENLLEGELNQSFIDLDATDALTKPHGMYFLQLPNFQNADFTTLSVNFPTHPSI